MLILVQDVWTCQKYWIQYLFGGDDWTLITIVLINSIICLNLHYKEIIDCTKKPFLHRDQQGRKYS